LPVLVKSAVLFWFIKSSRLRTRIKICGITRVEDAHSVVTAGADAIGLIFYPSSPRHVQIDQAKEVTNAVSAFVATVGVFVNPEIDYLREVLKNLPIDIIQFHGNESPEYCLQADKPYVKAIRVKDDLDLEAQAQRYSSSRGMLLDSFVPGVEGGTGETFAWDKVNEVKSQPVILAGGINHSNVSTVISEHKPYAIDISSGVETDKGIKSAAAIEQFVQAVRRQDQITYGSNT